MSLFTHALYFYSRQPNEYKISIYSGSSPGSTGTIAKANRGLQSDCQSDVVRIHDGPDTSSPILTELCGSGHLPAVVASTPVVLVTLYSSPDMILYDSRVELNIQVDLIRVQQNETLYTTDNICDQHFTADKMTSGIIATPTHTIPANSSCTYTFSSSRPDDRVWLYFASYYVPDANHWNSEEKCDSSKLEIYGAFGGERNESLIEAGSVEHQPELQQEVQKSSFSPLKLQLVQGEPREGLDVSGTSTMSANTSTLKYCEKNSPRVCGRALDSRSYLPSIPCTYPEESYLSAGPQMTIKQYHYKSNNLYAAGSSYLARFEFVDTSESGAPIVGTLCDRLFDSANSIRGELRSTHNVFMFGRGGRRDVSCAYKFVSKKRERLRLHLTWYRLNSIGCQHTMDAVSGQYVCRASASPLSLSPLTASVDGSTGSGGSVTGQRSERLATLMVLDTIKSEEISVGCFCSGERLLREKAITFDLIGSEVIVNLTVTGMQSTDDFNEFAFGAKYEFVPSEGECQTNGVIQQKDGREGEILYTVPPNHRFVGRETLKCRWLIESSVGKHLYLKFKGFLPK